MWTAYLEVLMVDLLYHNHLLFFIYCWTPQYFISYLVLPS
jgi:hypothetical protein